MSLDGLSPYAVYQLAVAALNDLARSEPSKEVQAKTYEGVPGAPPDAVKVRGGRRACGPGLMVGDGGTGGSGDVAGGPRELVGGALGRLERPRPRLQDCMDQRARSPFASLAPCVSYSASVK